MTADTCPIHAPLYPRLRVPDGAPCPFRGCAHGTTEIIWTATDGKRYLRSLGYVPEHWVLLSDCPAIDTTREGT